MKECKILGHKSYILRTDKNMSENRDHPLNLIEVISDVNFREKYNLKVRKLCTEFSFLQFLAIPDYLINSLIFICS